MVVTPAIVWFRLDLRIADNPALSAAVARGRPVVPVFIWAPEEEAPWQPGEASMWWLHHSLVSLREELRRVGARLVVRRGPTDQCLRSLLKETGARAVFWNHRYEPAVRERDERLKSMLREQGVEVAGSNGALLNEPWTIQNKSGGPFQVFTPFWKHCLSLPEPAEPLPAPRSLKTPSSVPVSLTVEDLGLLPGRDWTGGLRDTWCPGSVGAGRRLTSFLNPGRVLSPRAPLPGRAPGRVLSPKAPLLGGALSPKAPDSLAHDDFQPGTLGQRARPRSALQAYDTARDLPAETGTSRLSPHLHFGEISPRQVWHGVKQAAGGGDYRSSKFLCELGWREFSHHLLFHFPEMPAEPLRKEFAQFRWRRNAKWMEAWQRGRTGYPFVDAGLRELWSTGWMHNRVRMVAASFLVKHLLISWRDGAKWFWDTLVDADLAQNSMGWQWVAGCGADAAPFFRVFNPVFQGEKFDPAGAYIRRWVPELARLPDKWIHQPYRAPAAVLSQAGVEIGKTYPDPVVNHVIAREVALEAYAGARAGSTGL